MAISSLVIGLIWPYQKRFKSNHISSCKFSVYFARKNLLFLFYTFTFTKHQHQFIYFIHLFNKIFILFTFFIISFPLLLSGTLSQTQHKPKITHTHQPTHPPTHPPPSTHNHQPPSPHKKSKQKFQTPQKIQIVNPNPQKIKTPKPHYQRLSSSRSSTVLEFKTSVPQKNPSAPKEAL